MHAKSDDLLILKLKETLTSWELPIVEKVDLKKFYLNLSVLRDLRKKVACGFEHRWRARPENTIQGKWCPKCSYEARIAAMNKPKTYSA